MGISGDAVSNQELFKKTHQLNFTLLSDEDGQVAKKFGVAVMKGGVFKFKQADASVVELTRGVTEMRWTFVIDKDGKIIHKNPKADFNKDSKAVLAILEKKSN